MMNLKFQRKALKTIIFGIGILLISTCKKDNNCSSDIFGVYEGTESCYGSGSNIIVTLNGSSQTSKVTLTSLVVTGFIFEGNFSMENCTINLPNQNRFGQPEVINGTLNINRNNLNGTINYSGLSCTYDLSKQ